MIAHETCKKALEVFGIKSRLWLSVEEMSELMNAISKTFRDRAGVPDIIEEIADVQIMMDQLAIYFGEKEVNEMKIKKLNRLEETINNELKK